MAIQDMQETVDQLQPLKQRLLELLGKSDLEKRSICCNAVEHEHVDGMCSECNEMVKFEEISIFNNLRCPHRESTKFLCDREANYQVDGTVYCQIHAQRLLSEKTTEEGEGK